MTQEFEYVSQKKRKTNHFDTLHYHTHPYNTILSPKSQGTPRTNERGIIQLCVLHFNFSVIEVNPEPSG